LNADVLARDIAQCQQEGTGLPVLRKQEICLDHWPEIHAFLRAVYSKAALSPVWQMGMPSVVEAVWQRIARCTNQVPEEGKQDVKSKFKM
jgi:hypothetical protein